LSNIKRHLAPIHIPSAQARSPFPSQIKIPYLVVLEIAPRITLPLEETVTLMAALLELVSNTVMVALPFASQ
jgi:hypothetical protein